MCESVRECARVCESVRECGGVCGVCRSKYGIGTGVSTKINERMTRVLDSYASAHSFIARFQSIHDGYDAMI